MQLLSLTPEGKILLTLVHGKHSYSELRLETGLSDRWLTIKLEQLIAEGIAEKNGKWYGLTSKTDVSGYELSLYMKSQADCLANRLSGLDFVKAVFLFGSVAQKRAQEFSDLDLIIVVSKFHEAAKLKIMGEVRWFELTYHLTVEPFILTEEDFLDNVHSDEGGIIFGVAEGFEVLVDKTNMLTRVLRDRVAEIKCSHEFLKDERIWLRVK